jgi:hypothetical protein
MAVYVYNTASGELYSWSPGDDDPMAPEEDLTAAGLTAVIGLPAIDDTQAWDAVSKAVIAITPPPKPAPLLTAVWILRFTPAEFQAINNSTDAVVQPFMYALNHTTEVDLSTDTIVNGITIWSRSKCCSPRVAVQVPASRQGP